MNSTATTMRQRTATGKSQSAHSGYRAAHDLKAKEPSLSTLVGLIVLLVMLLCFGLLGVNAYTHPEYQSNIPGDVR